MSLAYAACASSLMLVLYFVLTANVGRMRARHAVAAPATSGHPDFERAYRVQLNTLEHMAIALPSLWIYAAFGSPVWAAVAAGVWIVGRIAYAAGYMRAPAARMPGMLVTMAGEIWLLGGAVWGSFRALSA